MTDDSYRFLFDHDIELDDAEMSLHLAIFAVEGLFGQARVRLDAGYALDPERHALVIDATTEVGAHLVRIFTGLLVREFGEESFRVEHVLSSPQEPCEPAAA